MKLRTDWLQDAAAALEPKPAGRPPALSPDEHAEIQKLRQDAKTLRVQLEAARIREQIALTMPHLLRDSKNRDDRGGSKKK